MSGSTASPKIHGTLQRAVQAPLPALQLQWQQGWFHLPWELKQAGQSRILLTPVASQPIEAPSGLLAGAISCRWLSLW